MQLITKQSFLACWNLLTFLKSSEDFPENMGPKITSMRPDSSIYDQNLIYEIGGCFYFELPKIVFISQSQRMKKQQNRSTQLQKTRIQELSSNQNVEDESTNLFIKFNEHNLKRVKDDNKRLLEKNTNLEAEIKRLTLQNDQLRSRSIEHEGKISENKKIIEKLTKDAVLNKEKLEGSLKNIDYMKALVAEFENAIDQLKNQLNNLKEQILKANISNLDLIKQNQNEKKSSALLKQQIQYLTEQIKSNLIEYEGTSLIYKNKIKCLQKQIQQMRTNIEDLIVQLKIYQSQKDVEKLLQVQHKINERILKQHQNLFEFENSPKQTLENRLCMVGKINRNLKQQNNRFNQASNKSEQQLKELIELLKEKNKILESNVEQKDKRNRLLQNIICNQMKS